MQRFLEQNPNLVKFYQLANDIASKRINHHTALQYYKTKEDVAYLFKIDNWKVLGDVKGTLQMITNDAGEDERQILDFLLRKKRVYKSALIVILCILNFKFVVHTRNQKSRKRNMSTYKFKFETVEEAFLYYLYIVYNVDKKYISILHGKIKQLPLKMALVAAYSLKYDELMKHVLDRWQEDRTVPQYVFEIYEPSYEYIASKMITLSNKEWLKILRIVNIDKMKIARSFLGKCMAEFMRTNDERLLNRNLRFSEICLEVNMSEDVFRNLEMNSSSGSNRQEKTAKAQIEIKPEQVKIYDGRNPHANQELHFRSSNICIMKKIVYAWLRILLATNNHLLFIDIFEKMKKGTCTEYTILENIYNKIMCIFKGINPNFGDLLDKYDETNEFSPISFSDLGKYLCKIQIV
ncbi:hypothetical protein VCUG_01127 [Vavraia culicis subsp. floridensis]|uniref:Uncharacterized protein n=1 Tax=Vavraia culicis (isolate floridensis) TaxID=948595 RepID=L2GVQ9_VAVCU|nr:uncharacterized protein VCUG_01127 [Vavraia culicis subsp. floridensis]ELA47358.1 hypothetical protein VCUG_01127 [Vavraia culicis subsp. floridensis]